MAKVLLLDIETAPNLGYTWGKWEQNVIAFQQQWYMLSFAWKWLDSTEVSVHGLDDFRGYKKDKTNDKALIGELWNVLDEADIVVAHNGDAFDIKKTNARFILHDLPPPSPYKTIDTLKIAKKHFRFESNKLNDLGEHLGLGAKAKTSGFQTWLGCMAGEPESWQEMKGYNAQDVLLLEKVYLKLRPWATTHPNLNGYGGEKENCPTCQSSRVQRRGIAYAKTRSYQRWTCMECHSWFQGDLIKKEKNA